MDILLKYFPHISTVQIKQFSELQRLYVYWNERINVISRKDIDHLYERHVLHSLSIAKIIQFKANAQILDVGTGGGFPGIPLAIMFSETNFHLVDSIRKKTRVVSSICSELQLTNVKSEQIRAEELNTSYDFIVSRAVTAFPDFVHWIKKNISKDNKHPIKNGIIYLKGGDFDEEIRALKNQVKVYEIPEFFEEVFYETKKIIYFSPYN